MRDTTRLVGLAALTALFGCSSERPAESMGLEISRAYIAEPVTAERTALYFLITNSGGTDDELTGVSTAVAGSAEIHRTVDDGGTMRMEPVASLTVPAGATVRLIPGGYHIMLTGLTRSLRAGDHVDVTLHFHSMGDVQIRPRVVEYADLEDLFPEMGRTDSHEMH